MFRHGEYSTEVDRKPFCFTLTALLGSLIAAVLVIVLSKGDALAIFAGVLLGIVFLASAAVLFAMTTDRAYIDEDRLYMQYLFKKTCIPLSEIGKVSCKDEIYSVYDRKGEVAGTINRKLCGIDSVLQELDRNHVHFV